MRSADALKRCHSADPALPVAGLCLPHSANKETVSAHGENIMLRRSTRISLASLSVLLCFAATSLRAAAADDPKDPKDPKEIVRRALRINARNRELERSYTYVQRDEERTLDSSGAVKRRESKTWDVVPLQGAQFPD
jgi:hypothetical protein